MLIWNFIYIRHWFCNSFVVNNLLNVQIYLWLNVCYMVRKRYIICFQSKDALVFIEYIIPVRKDQEVCVWFSDAFSNYWLIAGSYWTSSAPGRNRWRARKNSDYHSIWTLVIRHSNTHGDRWLSCNNKIAMSLFQNEALLKWCQSIDWESLLCTFVLAGYIVPCKFARFPKHEVAGQIGVISYKPITPLWCNFQNVIYKIMTQLANFLQWQCFSVIKPKMSNLMSLFRCYWVH